MWERFGYYGMAALLVLFMVQKLGYDDDKANLTLGRVHRAGVRRARDRWLDRRQGPRCPAEHDDRRHDPRGPATCCCRCRRTTSRCCTARSA
jgi:hypothetical protein